MLCAVLPAAGRVVPVAAAEDAPAPEAQNPPQSTSIESLLHTLVANQGVLNDNLVASILAVQQELANFGQRNIEHLAAIHASITALGEAFQQPVICTEAQAAPMAAAPTAGAHPDDQRLYRQNRRRWATKLAAWCHTMSIHLPSWNIFAIWPMQVVELTDRCVAAGGLPGRCMSVIRNETCHGWQAYDQLLHSGNPFCASPHLWEDQ